MDKNHAYETIIVGIDGSDAAKIAFLDAVYISKRNNAQLLVVQIINNVINYLPEEAINELTIDYQNRFSELKEQAKNIGFENLKSIILVGSPKKLITQTLPEDYNADLIVLGATGKHVISESLLGSLAHYATTHAVCNVLIVRK